MTATSRRLPWTPGLLMGLFVCFISMLFAANGFAQEAGDGSVEPPAPDEATPDLEQMLADIENSLVAPAEALDEPESDTPAPATVDESEVGGPDRLGVREFFDEQTSSGKIWQYIKPHILLRSGLISEERDITNRVLRQAGFKLYDAQFGFIGQLDEYAFAKKWKLAVRYAAKANFASGAEISDTYGETEVYSSAFGAKLRIGVSKVPFLHGELVSDHLMYFYDRPQYVKPYGSSYLKELVHIGLKRHAGIGLQLHALDKAFTLEGGVYTGLSKPLEEVWGTNVFAGRFTFNSVDWIHERVRIEVGCGGFYQKKMPQILENSRYAMSADARLHAFGAFLGAEWALQVMDDQKRAVDYIVANYKDATTRAMGYQVYAGYSFPKREYEIALRYQWWDPDDTNLDKPIPQNANQARRWMTVGLSWWPINLMRLMVNYTHKQELESAGAEEYTASRLKNVANDEVIFLLQVHI